MLSSWIVVSVLTDIGVIGNMIYMCLVAHDFLHSVEAPFWISNVVFLIIFRLCILIIASLGLVEMVKNSQYRDFHLPRPNTISHDLDPIGTGCTEFISYWKELPGSAVVVLLTVEVVSINIKVSELNYNFNSISKPYKNIHFLQLLNVLHLGTRTLTDIVFGLELLTTGYNFMGVDLYLFGNATLYHVKLLIIMF